MSSKAYSLQKIISTFITVWVEVSCHSALLWMQITEYTEYNYVTVALYYVRAELEKMMRTNKQTDREQRTDRQRTDREQFKN